MSEHNHDIDESASMDSDYGSSPRVGVDNCAATPVKTGGWQAALNEMMCLCQSQAKNMVRERPGTALLVAATAGFFIAGLLRRRRS